MDKAVCESELPIMPYLNGFCPPIGAGRKATMVLRMNDKGKPVKAGTQVVIGGEETYASVCRRHWNAGVPKKVG